ncbi:hypothetical protein G4D42_09580 [Burkholderia pseudomallei]|uniref:hypothetical protein n=1 Tax=Burkholderia pseudomallei TaxID=28450 RepID=UPI00117829FB|nr:hypothetical protein [Burkholderia pseudomallei]HDR9154315.1 hypothetical protein [Burkholderia vietnamiensis]NVH98442.1 hypothetical protein [Burkholderia pseudomallei]NVI23650.1 hypothetical protein [Burkholderia pseudomallei]CAJ3963197.1 Uncharacterised protein [Burkholderia pseudomallei]CAJ4991300.1 Uncharacterised protein [Burkholderia pseudomallei]
MTDGRPTELSEYLEGAKEKNDRLIADALMELEDALKRGKRKATVATICDMTGLSRNSVRGRAWALVRLKAIKGAIKSGAAAARSSLLEEEQPEATPRLLRQRIKLILGQNALLYAEILSLKTIIANQETEIQALIARSNISLAQPPGRVPE